MKFVLGSFLLLTLSVFYTNAAAIAVAENNEKILNLVQVVLNQLSQINFLQVLNSILPIVSNVLSSIGKRGDFIDAGLSLVYNWAVEVATTWVVGLFGNLFGKRGIVGAIAGQIWDNVVNAAIDYVVTGLQSIGKRGIWGTLASIAISALLGKRGLIGTIAGQIWDNVVNAAIDAVVTGLQSIGKRNIVVDIATQVWNNVVQAGVSALTNALSSIGKRGAIGSFLLSAATTYVVNLAVDAITGLMGKRGLGLIEPLVNQLIDEVVDLVVTTSTNLILGATSTVLGWIGKRQIPGGF